MKRILIAACSVALTFGGLTQIGVSPAAADPARSGTASGYGANINLLGNPAVNKAGLATATLPPDADAVNSLLLVPAAPIAISGTAGGVAAAHTNADIASALAQSTAGPYNAEGLGIVEGLVVLLGAGAAGVPLVSARVVRGDAVGVCRGTTASYSATSEIVELNIAGTAVPLNGPITGLIDTLNLLLAPLQQVISIQRNEVSVTAQGASVNALHVTLLSLPGNAPLLDLVVGHADVSGLACGPPIPQCSDNQDNDGDGVIDRNDPGCITNGVYDPNDNDERNECSDGIDNADPEDTLVDFGSDPGCSSAQDDDETDPSGGGGGGGGTLARTGGDESSTLPLAGSFGLLALAALALRRRSQASS